VLVEFASAVNAVACAVELQNRMDAANGSVADDRRIVLRIGINLGDVMVEGGDLYGEGVIVAVRLQAMADPGGICVSGSVHEQIGKKLPLAFDDIGPTEVKNIAKPVRVFRTIANPKAFDRQTEHRPAQSKPSIAVLPFTNEWRPCTGVLQRRHYRGHYHRADAVPAVVRDRPEFLLRLP
jgi:adenylate cyclase